MGAEFVVIFVSAVLVLCGVVLIFTSSDNSGRRIGFYMLFAGIIGVFISIIAYPRDKNYVPSYNNYTNESNNL